MFKRMYVMLYMLSKADDYTIDKKIFSNLLYVITKKQDEPSYKFVEQHWVSYQAEYDISLLSEKHGLVNVSEKNYGLKSNLEPGFFDGKLLSKDKKIIDEVFGLYYRDIEKLNNHVMRINPLVRPPQNYVYSIGYEGKSIDEYLTELKSNRIGLLIDVRRNAFSMNHYFTKKKLEHYCKKVSINYIHMPELGISSSDRKTLVTKKDYDLLFKKYSDNLPNKKKYLDQIKNFAYEYERVAVTCFEKNYKCCHRHIITNYIYDNYNISIKSNEGIVKKSVNEQAIPENLYEKRGVDFAKKDVHKAISENKERHNSIYKVYGGNTFAAAITGFFPNECEKSVSVDNVSIEYNLDE